MYNLNCELHQYYLSSTDKNLKETYFRSRKEAEAELNKFCVKNNLDLECVECDKHERRYSANNGAEFCINRI